MKTYPTSPAEVAWNLLLECGLTRDRVLRVRFHLEEPSSPQRPALLGRGKYGGMPRGSRCNREDIVR